MCWPACEMPQAALFAHSIILYQSQPNMALYFLSSILDVIIFLMAQEIDLPMEFIVRSEVIQN